MKARWRNIKTGMVISGSWRYLWVTDEFHICLDDIDEIIGRKRSFYVRGESPEWRDWKLQDDNEYIMIDNKRSLYKKVKK